MEGQAQAQGYVGRPMPIGSAGAAGRLTTAAQQVERISTRLEEATNMARDAADRVSIMTSGVRELADARLGPQPQTSAGTKLTDELQRLREL